MRLRPLARLILAFIVATAATVVAHAASDSKDKHPTLTLSATPVVAFAPVRVLLMAQVKGGADDIADFYCPAVEWDWGDGTTSESSSDCPPFEPGKTTIQRRYVMQHVFKEGGEFEVRVLLKQNHRVVTSASNTLEIHSALGDDDSDGGWGGVGR
jgi:hypothetical protein